MNSMQSVYVPNFANEDKQQKVYIKEMSPQAITTLKKKDPNLYYLIPGAENASLLSKDLDLFKLY